MSETHRGQLTILNVCFGQHDEAGNMESVQKSAVDVSRTRLQGRILGISYHRHSIFLRKCNFL